MHNKPTFKGLGGVHFRVNKRKLFAALGVLLILIVALVLILAASCADSVRIRSSYVTVDVPRELRDDLACWEETDGAVTHQIFALENDGNPLEVFRIVYGDASVGQLQGYLHTDAGAVPVTLVIADYESIEFPLGEDIEDIRPTYFSIMENIGVVLESIRADKRYSVSNTALAEQTHALKLSYFKVTIPAAIQCREAETESGYEATFYATIGGNEVVLYRIVIGDTDEGNCIGLWKLNGESRPVYVQTIDPDVMDSLPEADQATVAVLMESINDVVQTVTGSKDF
ncbi:MAG: hypothetical protein J6L88_02395, partial [Clostridia bacterium]|nr:hypothetical protein [Clostridia bacterium]